MRKRLLLLLIIIILATAVRALPAKREVLVLTYNGIINPVASEFITKAIDKASNEKAEAIVIELDTPGGLDTSMRDIVKKIIGSDTPVVVYVAPSGARAASAGVFITLSANIAAMAPGTNIGAAHPVSLEGKMDKTMAEKVVNDASAYIRSIAQKRGRNQQWAEDAVRKSISSSAQEALKEDVIDIISPDLNSLLKSIDGRTVVTPIGPKTIRTADAKLVRLNLGLRGRILNTISDPNVAYILMLLGFYGLFFELTSPGAILPGVVGTICLILAFYSFQTLPVNYAGLLLIILAIVLFILDVKAATHGVLTIGGIVSMIIGSLMLFESPAPYMRVSLIIILPVVILTAVFFTVIVTLVIKAHRKKPSTGKEGLIGLEGIARTDIATEEGRVFVHGELWRAWSDEPIKAGDKIVVIGLDGLKLKVKKKEGMK